MMESIRAYIIGCNKPWVIAADWNAPLALLRATGWLNRVQGHIRSPTFNTCEMGKGSIIDYVVVSHSMAALFEKDFLWTGAPTKPHHPYICSFLCDHKECSFPRGMAPRAFPVHPPSAARENRARTLGLGTRALCP